MPKIQAATNAEQREHTKHAILESFGQLLYQHCLLYTSPSPRD